MSIKQQQYESLFYRVSGNGNPVLFLHGFLEDATMWNGVMNALALTNLTCYAIDLPGHGRSPLDETKCSMREMAKTIANFCTHYKIENPHVFGHSMGGYVGLELAQLMDIKLTLVQSNFWADDAEKKKNRNRVISVVEKNKARFIDEAIPNLFASKNRAALHLVIEKLKKSAKKMDERSIIACTKAMRDRFDNTAVLHQQHVCIIQGEDDPVIPTKKLLNALEPLHENYTLFILKSCGHMGIWESPKTLINWMKMIVFK